MPEEDGRGRERRLQLPDTHAHLDAQAFDDDRDAVVERALAAGVNRILAVGSDYASSRKAVELARRYETVYAAIGVHPHEALRFEAEAEPTRALLGEPKVVAVGEIGLDYRREGASRENQLAVFSEQVRWARERGLPVSVHNREADQDVLAVLSNGPTAILHCFSSGWEVACAALDGGHYVSFAGNVTFPKAGELREVASRAPLDRMLVETDSPVLAPQRWRGRRNEPAYVAETARILAEARGDSQDVLARSVSANAHRLFGWLSQ